MRRPKAAVLRAYPDAWCIYGGTLWHVKIKGYVIGEGVTAFAAWHDAARKLVARCA